MKRPSELQTAYQRNYLFSMGITLLIFGLLALAVRQFHGAPIHSSKVAAGLNTPGRDLPEPAGNRLPQGGAFRQPQRSGFISRFGAKIEIIADGPPPAIAVKPLHIRLHELSPDAGPGGQFAYAGAGNGVTGGNGPGTGDGQPDNDLGHYNFNDSLFWSLEDRPILLNRPAYIENYIPPSYPVDIKRRKEFEVERQMVSPDEINDSICIELMVYVDSAGELARFPQEIRARGYTYEYARRGRKHTAEYVYNADGNKDGGEFAEYLVKVCTRMTFQPAVKNGVPAGHWYWFRYSFSLENLKEMAAETDQLLQWRIGQSMIDLERQLARQMGQVAGK